MKKLYILVLSVIISSCSSSLDSNENSNNNYVNGPNVTDVDGNVYQSVTNCNQTWTKQNLDVSKYTDGTPIPQVTDASQWTNLETGAWCYYNNDPANGTIYGKLYNWYAVEGIYNAASNANPSLRKKLVPVGWHIPTLDEFLILIDCLDPDFANGVSQFNIAGVKMKSSGFWPDTNLSATNESGFTALPGGSRLVNGYFTAIGGHAVWWTSTESQSSAWSLILNSSTNYANYNTTRKEHGLSIRCLKD